MLEYLVPENTDTQAARRLLSQKGTADLHKQNSELFKSLQRINSECQVKDDNGNSTGKFDYSKSSELTGEESDRHAQAMRRLAERRAIRQELQERADNDAIQREIEFGENVGNAYTDIQPNRENKPTSLAMSPEMKVESLIGNHVQALLDDSGSGAGFDPVKGGNGFIEAHKNLEIPNLTLPLLVQSYFGAIRQEVMTIGTSTSEGYTPFSYRDLNEAILSRQINSYTPMLPRMSTSGQLKVDYIRETAQDFATNLETTENPGADFAESDFTFAEDSTELRKLANTMRFSAEEIRSRGDFISLMTTRLVRGVMNRLEFNLVKGNNNAGNPKSGQMYGLETYQPAAAANTMSTAGELGMDVIEDRIRDMTEVANQEPTVNYWPVRFSFRTSQAKNCSG